MTCSGKLGRMARPHKLLVTLYDTEVTRLRGFNVIASALEGGESALPF